MKRVLLLLNLLLNLALTLQAQQISVKSFRPLSNDLDARTYFPKEDRNGEKAALIKIVTIETNFEFDAGSIGIVAQVPKTGEIWLYVPRGSKVLTIKHPKLGVLRNYPYTESIDAGAVYEMILTSGRIITTVEEQIIETQWLTFTTEPTDADVYINDKAAGKTPYQNELPAGKYTWRLSKELYLPEAGIVELLSGGEKQVMKVKLKPNFGTLNIRTEPEINGDIYINYMPTGKTTPCTFERVPAGDKTIQVKKDMYQISDQQLTLKPELNLPVVLTAKPTFGTLSISSYPESGATVSLNGSTTGKTTPCTIEKMPAGEYSITLSRNEYETTTQQLTLAAGETQKVAVAMSPTFAQVTVGSEPTADIYINGQLKINGLWQGRLNPGVYTFEAKIDKYNTASEKHTVIIGQPLEIKLSPKPKTGNLKIMTTPFEASIKIDDKELGKTPLTLKNHLIGNYTVELSLPGYATAYEKATITEGQTSEINTSLQNGMEVEITSNPRGAALFIDNKPTGNNPYRGILVFGSHSLRAENNGKKVEKDVQISPSGTSSFELTISSDYNETTSGLNLDMVFVQGGTFTMGSNDEKPVHQVILSDFLIGKYEVTQKQWYIIMGDNPSFFKNCDNCPVEQVSWNDIQAFLQKLNQITGKHYRLPTESEWEYAARGGNKSKGYIYSGSNSLKDVAWLGESKTHIVGEKYPNEIGLFDMSGNVWEWCNDWYGFYKSSSQTNPKGPSSGYFRVYRGSSWYNIAESYYTTLRNYYNPNSRYYYIGFRVVNTP